MSSAEIITRAGTQSVKNHKLYIEQLYIKR